MLTTHHVPNLEAALASKYAALVSPHRSAEKKALDEGDFISMASHNYEIIDLDILFSLAEMVKANGGAEIRRFVEQAKAGQRLGL